MQRVIGLRPRPQMLPYLRVAVAGASRGEIAALMEGQVLLTSFGQISKYQSICVADRGPRNLGCPDRAGMKPITLSWWKQLLLPHRYDKIPYFTGNDNQR